MKTKCLFLGLVTLTLCSVLSAALPLSDKLPEGSLLYLGWAGKTQIFDGAYIGQFLQEPEAKEFFAALQARCVASAKTPQESAIAKLAVSLHQIGWKHPMGLAVFDVTLPEPGLATRPEDSRPMITGAMLIDLGNDRAAFDQQLQALIGLLADRIKLTSQTAGAVTYQSFTCPGGMVSFGYVGNLFFLSLGEKAPAQVISLINGQGKSLDKDPTFAAAMKEVAGDYCQVALYKNVAKIYAVLDKAMAASEPAEATNPSQSELRHKLSVLGLANVTTFAAAGNLEDRKVHVKMRLNSPAPHRGILMLLAGAPLEDKNLALIPEDADFAIASHIQPLNLLTEVRRIANELEPRYAIGAAAALAAGGAVMGIDIEQDLLAPMGDQWTLIGSEGLAGFPTGVLLTVELKDPAHFGQTVDKIESYLARKTNRERFELRKMQFDANTDIHYVECFGKPVAPAWAVANNRLYFGLWPQVVAAALDSNRAKPLTGNADFQAVRRKIEEKPTCLLYLNEPQLLRRAYAFLLMAGTHLTQTPPPADAPAGGMAAAGTPSSTGPATMPAGRFLPEMIPALPKLEKYFTPEITTLSSDPRGLSFEAYGSMPLPSLVTAAVPLLPLMPFYQHAMMEHHRMHEVP